MVGLSVSWLDSTDDPQYKDVLIIRALAYAQRDKVPKGTPPSAMADQFDRYACIAILLADSQPVGTIRVFTEPDRKPCDEADHARYEEIKLDKSEYITASRLSILPNHQSLGYFKILHDLMPLLALQCGRRFVVGSAAGRLISAYERLGWDRMGIMYEHEDFHGIAHEYIRLDVAKWIFHAIGAPIGSLEGVKCPALYG